MYRDNLFGKYQLIIFNLDKDGFCEGVVKRNDGTRSLCFAAPNFSPDSMYSVYVLNDNNKNFTCEQILHSDAFEVDYGTFKKTKRTTKNYENLQKSLIVDWSILSTIDHIIEEKRRKLQNPISLKRKEVEKLESEAKLKEEYATNPPKDLVQLRKMQTLFLQENSAPQEKWSVTAREVDKYIRDKINLLYQGKPATLPYFFHATGKKDKLAFSSILEKKFIESSNAEYGYGVYISNYDESDSYGPRTFAFPEEAIYKDDGKFFTSIQDLHPEYQKYRSLWVRMDRSLEVSTETLAHVVVKRPEDCPQVKEELAKHKIDAPVITRAASRWITKLIEATGKKYQLPSHWHELDYNQQIFDSIPENVIPYSAAL